MDSRPTRRTTDARPLATRGVVAWAGLVALLGCARTEGFDDRLPVVLVSSASALPPALGLDKNGLVKRLRESAERTGVFRAEAPSSAPAFVLDVDGLSANRDAPDGVQVTVQLALLLPPNGAERLERSATGTDKDAAAALVRALDQASAGLGHHYRARLAAPATLVEWLASEDRTRADAALEQLVQRRDPHATDPLLARLAAPSEDDSLRALSGLVALHEPRTARAVVAEAERRTLAYRLVALDALAALGGDDAEAYLFACEAGDPEPLVRETARRLRARAAPPTPETAN